MTPPLPTFEPINRLIGSRTLQVKRASSLRCPHDVVLKRSEGAPEESDGFATHFFATDDFSHEGFITLDSEKY